MKTYIICDWMSNVISDKEYTSFDEAYDDVAELARRDLFADGIDCEDLLDRDENEYNNLFTQYIEEYWVKEYIKGRDRILMNRHIPNYYKE
jgi:hypothetical protein